MDVTENTLEKYFTKKTPSQPPDSPNTPDTVLSWEARVPMLTNPVFMFDALLALFFAWFFPSALFALILDFSGFSLEAILYVSLWIGICIAILGGTCFFFILVKFQNVYYAKYTLSATGIACAISHDITPEAGRRSAFFSLKASPIPPGSISFAKTEKWAEWEKIRKVGSFPSLRVVTLSDRFLPIFRIFCPDDLTFTRTLEFCVFLKLSPEGGNVKE